MVCPLFPDTKPVTIVYIQDIMSLGQLHTLIKAIIHAIVNQIFTKQSQNLKQSIYNSYPMILMIGFSLVSKLNFPNRKQCVVRLLYWIHYHFFVFAIGF